MTKCKDNGGDPDNSLAKPSNHQDIPEAADPAAFSAIESSDRFIATADKPLL
jgi:hypothetical protein